MSISANSLADKYRPGSFSQVVGQEVVVRTLANGILLGRIPPVMMFTGPRGTGKTTLARIVAKSLNCLYRAHGNPEPCNQCPTCLEISRDECLSVAELDAASQNKVDDAHMITEMARMAPPDTFRVIILDEVHMMTSQAFNALLKTFEEPPPTTKFILCTTEKDKIPDTILSRSQIHYLRRTSSQAMVTHLENIAQHEGVTYEREALMVMAELSDGCVRDAVRNLDQSISFIGDNLSAVEIGKVFGALPLSYVLSYLHAVVADDLQMASSWVEYAYKTGADLQDMMERAATALIDIIAIQHGCRKRWEQRGGTDSPSLQALLQFPTTTLHTLAELFIRRSSQATNRVQVDLTTMFAIEASKSSESAHRVLIATGGTRTR